MINIIDINEPERVNRPPDSFVTLFSGENYSEHGFSIHKIELRHYLEKTDETLGTFSLITSFVETDKGSIEMKYDEGYLGKNSLDKAKEFLITNLGVSGIILRSIISLESALKND